MRMLFKALGAVIALTALQISTTNANVLFFAATMTGAQENPPNASTGTGSAFVTLDDVADTLMIDETFSGLSAPAAAAHIHCCQPAGSPTNAPVVINFIGRGFPTGVTSGTYDHTFNLLTDLSGITLSAFISGLESGLAYVNIHDANFPAGEIRGQLTRVPEPASLAIFGLGVGLLGLIKRRKVAA